MNKQLIDEYRNKLLNNKIEFKRDIFDMLYKELKDFNIAMIGLRQLGKTVLAEQLVKKYLFEEGGNVLGSVSSSDATDTNDALKNLKGDRAIQNPDDKFIYLNLKSFTDVTMEDVQNEINGKKFKIVLIDEIQMIQNWSSLVQVLVDLNPNTRFIFTGSNASSLTRETAFQRVKTFNIYPLNFSEFKNIWGMDNFATFVNVGSYPKNPRYDSPLVQYSEIINDLIIDKVATEDNEGINPTKLRNFTKSIVDYVGNEINQSSLAASAHVTRPTTASYIKVMKEAMLIKTISKYGDRNRRVKEKVYFVDKSMTPHFAGEMSGNEIGSLMENVVFSRLAEKYEFKYGSECIQYFRDKLDREVDFIIPEQKILVECKYTSNLDPESLSNELNDVIKSSGFEDYDKTVVTINFKGIVNGWNFVPIQEYIGGN